MRTALGGLSSPMLLRNAISFGNLTLDVSRTSGFFPDIGLAKIGLYAAGSREDATPLSQVKYQLL